MNREFCPEKNGIKNWCKNRYKRISTGLNYHESVIDNDAPVILNDFEIAQTQSSVISEGSSTMKSDYLVSNISIIRAVIKNEPYLKLPIYYLKNLGFNYESFEQKYQFYNTDLFAATYGPYAIAWGYENHILLTHKNQIPWIQ
jgi:hypothetical protein